MSTQPRLPDMTSLFVSRSAGAVLGLFVLIGCNSGAPSTITPATTPVPTSRPAATPAGGPATADGLCSAFTEQLAVAALGGPVDEPQSGDVLPRPNGIYCHYILTGNANTNAEAQLKEMTREELEALADNVGATTPLPGVGEVAFSRASAILGVPGAAVAAWSDGRGVTVSINRDGDQAAMLAAATAIASAALLANP
jgi:hypothetical protein